MCYKTDWVSLCSIVFPLFYFVFQAISKYKPRWAYIGRDDLTEVFLHNMSLGGLYLEGLIYMEGLIFRILQHYSNHNVTVN